MDATADWNSRMTSKLRNIFSWRLDRALQQLQIQLAMEESSVSSSPSSDECQVFPFSQDQPSFLPTNIVSIEEPYLGSSMPVTKVMPQYDGLSNQQSRNSTTAASILYPCGVANHGPGSCAKCLDCRRDKCQR